MDGRSVIVLDNREAENVKHIFYLYAYQNCTIDMVLQKLNDSGRNYTAKQPKWVRSKIHRILRDRSYIGDIKWHGHRQAGRHNPLVERVVFDRVQPLLGDKIYKAHELLYAGELIKRDHCGRPVTGEIVEKKSGKTYTYYRCARYTAPGHPRDRVRETVLDQEMLARFDRIWRPQFVQDWFRVTLSTIAATQHEQSRARCSELQQQLTATRRQQERLLNLHLSENLDEATFAAKNTELRDRIATLTPELEGADRQTAETADNALKVFELSQSLPKRWLQADYAEKRRIIEMFCLNSVLKGAILCVSTRKPFNALVEGLRPTVSGEGGKQNSICCDQSTLRLHGKISQNRPKPTPSKTDPHAYSFRLVTV